jgi:hypothetical protein
MALAEKPPARLETEVFPSALSPRSTSPSDAYEAAMRAADAVFGKSLPNGPAMPGGGRVLPSLVESPAFADAERATDDAKPRRGRPPGKTNKKRLPSPEKISAKPKRSSPAKRAVALKPAARLAPAKEDFEPTPLTLAPVATTLSDHAPPASSPARERRSIQKRWVLKTELKAGENWKRRLCKAAR